MDKVKSDSRPQVVLVHTGASFPGFINDCIAQLLKYDFLVHLITDAEHIQHVARAEDIMVCPAEDLFDQKYLDFCRYSPFDKNFRDAFFIRASSRFFLLRRYAELFNLKTFFHIENDVLVFSDFNNILQKLVEFDYEMGVVIDAPTRCIPSVVYFKDSSYLSLLCTWMNARPQLNDMESIFYFWLNQKSRIVNFPILPSDDTTGTFLYSNLFPQFNSIFDAAAIGQFLGGVDPRNKDGNTTGFVNETCIFNASHFKYSWENHEPYLITKRNEKIKINNLHVHSKDLKKFMHP